MKTFYITLLLVTLGYGDSSMDWIDKLTNGFNAMAKNYDAVEVAIYKRMTEPGGPLVQEVLGEELLNQYKIDYNTTQASAQTLQNVIFTMRDIQKKVGVVQTQNQYMMETTLIGTELWITKNKEVMNNSIMGLIDKIDRHINGYEKGK